MAIVDFDLADNLTVTPGALTQDVITTIWTSSEMTAGSANNNARFWFEIHSFDPDTDNPAETGWNFKLQLIIEEETEAGVSDVWWPIGVTNISINKIETHGALHEIILGTNLLAADNGTTYITPDVNNNQMKTLSPFREATSGYLRARLVVVDHDTVTNPFVSVTFSLRARRY